jgi:hypothetical protein
VKQEFGGLMAIQDSLSPQSIYPHWQDEYAAALVDIGCEGLKERIDAAEEAIERRLQQLAHDSNHHTERRVIHDALISLQLLKRFSESDESDRMQ